MLLSLASWVVTCVSSHVALIPDVKRIYIEGEKLAQSLFYSPTLAAAVCVFVLYVSSLSVSFSVCLFDGSGSLVFTA